MDKRFKWNGTQSENVSVLLMKSHSCVLQGTTGSQYFAGGQCRVSGGAEIPENPAGGGTGAWSSFQALPAQHPLSLHGAGLPRCGRGQSVCNLI